MSSDYSSDDFIVGEHVLKKDSNTEESEDYYEEEEEKRKENINPIIQKESEVSKKKEKSLQAKNANKKVQESYSSSESEDEAYEVEKIVNHRMKNGRLQYYLKWVGYESSENTWEYEDNLDNCPLLIKEYWEKRGNEKIKKNELKMFQKKELEIRKKKLNEKGKMQTMNRIYKKKENEINPSIIKKTPIFHQIPFPNYDIPRPKYSFQSIMGFQIKDQKLYYNVSLNNNDTITLTSNEIQKVNPKILLDYIEKIFVFDINRD
ncbi:Chromobox protein 1 [Tritrichomonas musculus]|uniref:Chromobox protein 1 n=1 Tax=Tritrichomonas musculus TaxID=1915356 RepID=A0ABR2KRE8_9EUKA